MKNPNPLRRPVGAALAMLPPTLCATLPAHAAEHTVTFESGLGGWKSIEDTSKYPWVPHSGRTPSYYTGPSGAYQGEYYLYLETSYGNTPGKIAYLESPAFEEAISGMTFHYHMHGRQMGTLAVETFDGAAWSAAWRINGQQHTGYSSAWTRKRIDLAGRTVRKIRFKGTTGSGYQGDMAIDQVTVVTGEAPPPPVSASPWSKSGNNIHYADGDVGIGTNSPTADLSILGNLSRPLTGHIMVTAGSSAVTGEETLFTKELRVGDSLLIGREVFVVAEIQSDTALTVDIAPTVSAVNAVAYTDGDLLSVETGAEKTALVVNRTGNVGIGAPEPKAKLDVAGGIRVDNQTACDEGKAGTLRYNAAEKAMEVCDGSAWTRSEGPEGPEGPRGPKGEKGDTGATGAQGEKGERGFAGAMGPRGLKGEKGDRGETGQRGFKGDKGDTGKTGLRGEKGDKGDVGLPGPGTTTLKFVVYHANTSTYACVNKDLENYCGDGDGCKIRLLLQHETEGNDQVRVIEETIYMEQSSLSNNRGGGVYGWTRQSGGGDHAWITSASGRYTIFAPWGWTWAFNYRHDYCPGQSGHSAPYSNPYLFTFMSHPHIKTSVVVYD
uniref:Collagen triple helix repeat-containing protein n=1 Tax=Candidatus Kentrum sp. TC TaxID=2126339 RepID=A0A450YIN5_9GAMM|nr:MAG: Collagen triple helix repeat-containing protein [Candidatus Kentron sp. TC]